MTIKPLVELLDVKRKKRALPTVSEEIHSRVRRGNAAKIHVNNDTFSCYYTVVTLSQSSVISTYYLLTLLAPKTQN